MSVQNNKTLIQRDTFAVLDNYQDSRSTSDLFYVNIDEISSVENFLDTDGFYKLSITFSDGKVLEMGYLTEERMNHDLSLIFPDGEIEPEDSDGSEDSDDSEGSDTSETPGPPSPTLVRCCLTGRGVEPEDFLFADRGYYIYATTDSAFNFVHDDENGLFFKTKNIILEGNHVYVNVYYRLISDPDYPSQDHYEFAENAISVCANELEATDPDQQAPSGFRKAMKIVNINSSPIQFDDI